MRWAEGGQGRGQARGVGAQPAARARTACAALCAPCAASHGQRRRRRAARRARSRALARPPAQLCAHLGVKDVFEHVADLLDRHALARDGVLGRRHAARRGGEGRRGGRVAEQRRARAAAARRQRAPAVRAAAEVPQRRVTLVHRVDGLAARRRHRVVRARRLHRKARKRSTRGVRGSTQLCRQVAEVYVLGVHVPTGAQLRERYLAGRGGNVAAQVVCVQSRAGSAACHVDAPRRRRRRRGAASLRVSRTWSPVPHAKKARKKAPHIFVKARAGLILIHL
jgi:hypothetical protein